MNSPKQINYETRPFKFTERKMLLASLQKVCSFYGGDYQYIGLGGIAYTDFKLFHKELHVDNLYSIEGGNIPLERLIFNSPYSFIRLLKNKTTIALNDIPLNKKSLIWLDYDGVLDNYMFDDLNIIFRKLPIGSIYIFTCNRELKDEENNEYTTELFREKFGNLIPFGIENKDFTSLNNYKTIRNMFINHINSILRERNRIEDLNFQFHQLFNILYQENRGARMYTFGGIITDNDLNLSDLDINSFNFINTEENAYRIEIPNLTRKEIDLINSYLYVNEEELVKLNIVTKSEVDKYKETYKYMPHYYDIRL